MAELLSIPLPGLDLAASPLSPTERRLRREWDLLKSLVRLNPDRLRHASAQDATFHVHLSKTPALALTSGSAGSSDLLLEHRLRLFYPRFFPAVPLELYLERPVRHPNVHPISGFVCLWQTYRVDYTVEHALHRTAAILGWRLQNLDARHVMQHDTLSADRAEVARLLEAPPLAGLDHAASQYQDAPAPRRRRLS